MKTIYLLFTVILWALSFNTGIAQTTVSNDSVEQIEKEYKGETYIINSSSQNALRGSDNNQMSISTTISNKNEGAFSGSAAGVCYNLKETIPLEEVFKKAISKEKIKSLALSDKNGILIMFYYDMNTGKIAHLRFRLVGNTTLSNDTDSETEITLKDISTLESLFKEYYFNVSEATCEKFEFGNRYYMFWFSKLAEEEKE
ncbi:hypothetical protein FACS189437_04330 [Bacteroidia bacterium]|nr:hypothetical protein FACS189437_04330 [Bacteroidia bacterium]